jgi:nicotinamide riboside kinase
MKMRVNLLGGPGSGKSTTAAWLFSVLKENQISVELVTEYVKSWACQKRQVTSFDQVYFLGKQMQYEYRFLNAGVKNIVTDSPVFLSAIYSEVYYKELNISKPILELVDAYEKQFPSVNIFLNRKNKPYVQEGRYQNYEQAKKVDELIRQNLFYRPDWKTHFIDYDDRAEIMRVLADYIPELKERMD